MIKTPTDIYHSRLRSIRRSIRRKAVDGFLVTDINNIRYLTGFSGSSGFLFITGKENIFVTDFRYKEQSEREVEGWEILIEMGNRIKIIRDLTKKNDIKKLGFESSVSYDFFRTISGKGMNLKALTGLIEKLRKIKDITEINLIKEAVRRAEAAFLEVEPYIRAGIRETAIARRLSERLKKKGCRCIPFDIIVASGPNSAMPHARPTEKKLNKGDLVIVDWGGEADGSYSEMTRTLLMKGSELGRKEIYQTVMFKQRAISCVAQGMQSKKIDDAARTLIRDAGYEEFFGHGTGHGIGLQVHEAPRVSWNKSERIRENMVFTVEPGIYILGLGGVRIEDIVVAGEKKSEVLTSLEKNLAIL
jgi:Xaa-Pro aminopeptidase